MHTKYICIAVFCIIYSAAKIWDFFFPKAMLFIVQSGKTHGRSW